MIAWTWFSNEKLFTVRMPTKFENDRVYAAVPDVLLERLLRGSRHLSRTVMVSLSKLRKRSLMFVGPGTKINSNYLTMCLMVTT